MFIEKKKPVPENTWNIFASGFAKTNLFPGHFVVKRRYVFSWTFWNKLYIIIYIVTVEDIFFQTKHPSPIKKLRYVGIIHLVFISKENSKILLEFYCSVENMMFYNIRNIISLSLKGKKMNKDWMNQHRQNFFRLVIYIETSFFANKNWTNCVHGLHCVDEKQIVLILPLKGLYSISSLPRFITDSKVDVNILRSEYYFKCCYDRDR